MITGQTIVVDGGLPKDRSLMIRAALLGLLAVALGISTASAQTATTTATLGVVGSAATTNGFPSGGGAIALPSATALVSTSAASTTTTTITIPTLTTATVSRALAPVPACDRYRRRGVARRIVGDCRFGGHRSGQRKHRRCEWGGHEQHGGIAICRQRRELGALPA
jgi:hypothetical protein